MYNWIWKQSIGILRLLRKWFRLLKIWLYHSIELIELYLELQWNIWKMFLDKYGMVLLKYGANITYVLSYVFFLFVFTNKHTRARRVQNFLDPDPDPKSTLNFNGIFLSQSPSLNPCHSLRNPGRIFQDPQSQGSCQVFFRILIWILVIPVSRIFQGQTGSCSGFIQVPA